MTDITDDPFDPAEVRTAVRERYGRIATESTGCCGPDDTTCGSSGQHSTQLGYDPIDFEAIAGEANLNLGCGNPTAIASLDPGETVLDLGSGGGFDCFLAAREVGPSGRVIGVDMTPEMVEQARDNVAANEADLVEFRLGEIEHLPVADASVDVIISNCVINLSVDKPQVFREAYRVLRPDGRLAIADVVLSAEPPADVEVDLASITACVGGAVSTQRLEASIRDAGFVDVSIEPQADSEAFISEWSDERDLSEYLVSATIEGRKPPSASPDG